MIKVSKPRLIWVNSRLAPSTRAAIDALAAKGYRTLGIARRDDDAAEEPSTFMKE